MRYLDPKNDLTFKKVFGEHPHLLISLLNSLLPLEDGQEITSIEYLPTELTPRIPVLKNTIVDVRCIDNRGRQFIVEMQMLWTDSFKSRVLFNASKAYVKQLGKGWKYEGLNPVYSLNLVNENFEKDCDEYYHHYSIIHNEMTGKKIEGLEFVFVELPKFRAKNLTEKKLQVLWLRYLTEIEDETESPLPEDLLANPLVREAIECLEESAFSTAELEAYDKYWDGISTEKTIIADSLNTGRKKGREEGKEEGLKLALKIFSLHKEGKSPEEISSHLNLPLATVQQVLTASLDS